MDIQNILKASNTEIHFIGIGGVSMSSLATLLHSSGHKITGSDSNISSNTEKLIKSGIKVSKGHSKENIKSPDLVVYTAAISKDNEELCEAYNKNIPVIERSVLLGEIMRTYEFPINVAGTHGKTTTTSMLADIFLCARLNPTVSVGGNFSKIGGNLHIGTKKYFICEACEYVESFLEFYPYTSIILNIDADHLDYFRDIEHIKSAFVKFTERTSENGAILINGDDENCKAIISQINRTVYTFGLEKSNTAYADNITYDSTGRPSYDLYFKGELMGNITLGVRGIHNVVNSLSAALCALLYGVDIDAIKQGLKEFTGAERRFQHKGAFGGVTVYDDYAHHPTELKSTLNNIKNAGYKSTFVIFQPHTYTRTHALLNDFAEVLKDAENLIIADIYAAREKNTVGISSKDLADKIPGAKYIPTFDEIEKYIKEKATPGDLVVTVGAGDVFKIGENLLKG